MDKEIIQTPIALIIKHFLLLTISCLIAAGYENKTAQGKYHPTRFTIKSQGHGTILKVMSDGHIKSEESHPGLLQSSNIWFHACGFDSIIDNPISGSLNFTICHDHQDKKYLDHPLTMVFDKVNGYFKMHPIENGTYQDTCDKSSCLYLPVKADVIGIDDYDDSEFYCLIRPSDFVDNRTMYVKRILGNEVYGLVYMARQPKNWDVYQKHSNTLLKLHIEK